MTVREILKMGDARLLRMAEPVQAFDTPELQALLKDLFSCEMPYCCPHGRPTLVQISTAELERKFGRRAPG